MPAFSKYQLLLSLLLIIIACQTPTPSPTPTLASTNSPTQTPPPTPIITSPTPTPTLPPTATVEPSATATIAPTIPPTPTPTPHPLSAYTIPHLQTQQFFGGQIEILATLEQSDAFTRHYIQYPSGGLQITGVMHVPTGSGPSPVLILLHGYYDRDAYFAGAGTWQTAEYFARQGYLVIAPDFRSWGESDVGLSLFHMGLVVDVLNLIGSVSTLPQADPARIGLWGHSMGGGIATKVLTIDQRVRAAVLYAPNSADDADLISRWGVGCLAGQSEAAGDMCNPAEVIPPETPPDMIEAYLSAATDPAFLSQISPIYHLERVSVPVQVHIGTADGALLAQTPPEWSEKLVGGLENAGKTVTLYTYANQGHFFTGDSWATLLTRAHDLFSQQLTPNLHQP